MTNGHFPRGYVPSISWLGAISSMNLRWLPSNHTATTSLQEVTAPGQEIEYIYKMSNKMSNYSFKLFSKFVHINFN